MIVEGVDQKAKSHNESAGPSNTVGIAVVKRINAPILRGKDEDGDEVLTKK